MAHGLCHAHHESHCELRLYEGRTHFDVVSSTAPLSDTGARVNYRRYPLRTLRRLLQTAADRTTTHGESLYTPTIRFHLSRPRQEDLQLHTSNSGDYANSTRPQRFRSDDRWPVYDIATDALTPVRQYQKPWGLTDGHIFICRSKDLHDQPAIMAPQFLTNSTSTASPRRVRLPARRCRYSFLWLGSRTVDGNSPASSLWRSQYAD